MYWMLNYMGPPIKDAPSEYILPLMMSRIYNINNYKTIFKDNLLT